MVDASDGHGAIGGDVLPAICERRRNVRRADGVTDIRSRLEQIGTSGAEGVGDRKIGAAAGEREACQRER